MKEDIFSITGMVCASCSAAVERITAKTKGVKKSQVNLTTGKMLVRYDESKITPNDIIKAVERAGFGASLDEKKTNRQKEEKKRQEQEQKALKEMKRRVILAFCFAIPLLYVSMGHMLPIPLPLPKLLSPDIHPFVFAFLQLALTLPVMFLGRKHYLSGGKALLRGHPNMDSLVLIGTLSAFLWSVAMTVRIGKDPHAVHSLYFESTAVVMTLIMLGKYFERKSKGKTTEAIIKLMALAPETAVRFTPEAGVCEVPLEEVQVGDILLVHPGEKIPIDGVIIEGHSSVDEAMLTGESTLQDKTVGDKVTGGSINCHGAFQMKVTEIGEDTTLAKILKLMEDAQTKKAPISKLADKVAGIFVPAVMTVAFLSALLWWVVGKEDLGFVLKIFVSVLVIACPCALGLATPTAIMVGTGVGAANGIFIRSGEALELLGKVTAVVLDKTGTVTEGQHTVTEIYAPSEKPEEVLRLAAAVESMSEHPLGRAILGKAQEEGLHVPVCSFFEATQGQGVKGVTEGKTVYVGNSKLMATLGLDTVPFEETVSNWTKNGKTPMYCSYDGEVKGVMCLADQVKPSAKEAIKDLKSQGKEVYLLTGDHKATAEHIGQELGITHIIAEALPQDKTNLIASLQEAGHTTLMVGDGINDAPALALAHVGMAIGSGSDIAIEAGDVVLTKSDPLDICRAIRLSKKTLLNIKENLFWAFAFNTVGIPIAAGFLHLFGGPLLSPMLGGLAMSFSSVLVVSNALRLKNIKLK